MPTLFTGQHVIRLGVVDSTNNYAAKVMELTQWENGTAILAETQTNGRGQMGNTWASANKNLFCSYMFKLPFLGPLDLPIWNQAVALAVYRAVAHFTQEQAWIKWPNDIICQRGKLGGILVENSLQGKQIKGSIVGVGLNSNEKPEIITAAKFNSDELDNEELLSFLSSSLEQVYLNLKARKQEQIVLEYNEVLWGLGTAAKILLNGKEKEVVFEGQDKNGNASFLSAEGRLSLGIKSFEYLSLPYSK